MNALYSRARALSRCCATTPAIAFLCVTLASVPADAAEAVTMDMASQAIDLDSGTVFATTPSDPAATGSDIKLAYNADRTPHAVVFPVGDGVELAFIAGVGFDGVTPSELASLTFSTEPPDLPFSANDCVVVRTDLGVYFKLGNAIENGLSITFNFEQL